MLKFLKMDRILNFIKILVILPAISCVVSGDTLIGSNYFLIQETDGWLKFHHTPQVWKDAVLTCFNEGAVLASPINSSIADALTMEMMINDATTPIFTGISNVYSNAVYQSMEGIPTSEICLNWSSEPHASGSENCLGMFTNGTVVEVSCTEPRQFACYRKKKVVNHGDKKEFVNGCGTSDSGYTYNEKTGNCYKLHTNKANWHAAFKVCDAEGGHLAIINSQAEAKVIWEMGYHSTWTYALALGFREWGKERTWITIQGQSLKAAGYDNWYPGEPNILTENCGCFVHWGSKSGGILADMPCLVDVMFICEIEPSQISIH